MGRFLAIVLALSGCGRMGFDDPKPGDSGDDTTTDPTMPTAKLMPRVCGSSSLTQTLVNADDLDLAIAVTPTGPTLFGVDKAGGSLRGMELTPGFASGTARTVRGGAFTSVSATYVDNKLFASAVNSTVVAVHTVPAGLASYNEIADLDGMYVAKDMMMNVNGDRITPTSCSAGLTVNPFDASWQPTQSQLTVNTSQSTGIAATMAGNDAYTVWSTDSECHFDHITSASAGTASMRSWACPAARLSSAQMVFEGSDGVRSSGIAGDALLDSDLIAAGASSPRIVDDGTRTWISYLDTTGAVAVGTLVDGMFQAVVTDASAKHDAYELAVIGGEIWVVAASKLGIEARMICLE